MSGRRASRSAGKPAGTSRAELQRFEIGSARNRRRIDRARASARQHRERRLGLRDRALKRWISAPLPLERSASDSRSFVIAHQSGVEALLLQLDVLAARAERVARDLQLGVERAQREVCRSRPARPALCVRSRRCSALRAAARPPRCCRSARGPTDPTSYEACMPALMRVRNRGSDEDEVGGATCARAVANPHSLRSSDTRTNAPLAGLRALRRCEPLPVEDRGSRRSPLRSAL